MRLGETSIAEAVSEAVLKSLIEVQITDGREGVKTREGVRKEFKESFNFRSFPVYRKTMAAFANAQGGYIIFGVTDNPRTLKGLSGYHLDQFDNLERAKVTDDLNEFFSPEIHWEAETFKFEGKTLGVIYVPESDNKPIVAKKSFSIGKKNVHEGDILYRYNSRSEKIKYPELNRIIIESREQEAHALLNQFKYLIETGAKNAAILDLSRHEVRGANGQRLFVDQSLVESISFIREGQFKETEGAPTLKLIGEVLPANTIALSSDKIIHSAINSEDLLEQFLHQDPSDTPGNYVRAAATGSSAFVPVHFFRKAAGWSVDFAMDAIRAEKSRSQAKRRLLKRLEDEEQILLDLPSPKSTHKSTKKKLEFVKRLKEGDGQLVGISNSENAKLLLTSIQYLTNEEVADHFDLYCQIILDCLNSFYEEDSEIANQLRRACCRLDIAMYGDEGGDS